MLKETGAASVADLIPTVATARGFVLLNRFYYLSRVPQAISLASTFIALRLPTLPDAKLAHPPRRIPATQATCMPSYNRCARQILLCRERTAQQHEEKIDPRS
jgi:hypothetical protein